MSLRIVKSSFFERACAGLAVAGAILVFGCGHKGGEQAHGHDHEKEGKAEGGHGHDEHGESPSGASFKPGKGVIVTEETRQILGVLVAEVSERKLPRQIRFTVQIYGGIAATSHLSGTNSHTLKASGSIPSDEADFVRVGQPVRLASRSGATAQGMVSEIHKTALADTEVDVTTDSAVFKPGEFLSATITVPREELVPVIPREALLRTAEGTFVYVVNGDAYLRTTVKVGAEADDLLEITDGLLAGDQVVTKPPQTLWLIELRATKGGGHSH